jgi:hypothetical protein
MERLPGRGQVAEFLVVVLGRVKVTDGEVVVIVAVTDDDGGLNLHPSPAHLVEEVSELAVP